MSNDLMPKVVERLRGFSSDEIAIDSSTRLYEEIGLDSLRLVMLISVLCDDFDVDVAVLQSESLLGVSTAGELSDLFTKLVPN